MTTKRGVSTTILNISDEKLVIFHIDKGGILFPLQQIKSFSEKPMLV
jgi:hypothetical protein